MAGDPHRPADDEARQIAAELLSACRHAALAVAGQGPDTPPVLARIACLWLEGAPVALMSSLSLHRQALSQRPACALLIGAPPERGDALTAPRLTLECRAEPVPRAAPAHVGLRDAWLRQLPKARLYADFTDFDFTRFRVTGGMLNAGFGRAYLLGPADLPPASPAQ